jgi:hypothetical protein
MQAGTSQCKIVGKIRITLKGIARAPPPVGYKAIGVYPGGALELHGFKVNPSRLAVNQSCFLSLDQTYLRMRSYCTGKKLC